MSAMMGVFHLTKQIYVGIFCNCVDRIYVLKCTLQRRVSCKHFHFRSVIVIPDIIIFIVIIVVVIIIIIIIITGSAVALHCCKAHSKSIGKMENSTPCRNP